MGYYYGVIVVIGLLLFGIATWVAFMAPCGIFRGMSITDVPSRCVGELAQPRGSK